jgi:hypothetical protein
VNTAAVAAATLASLPHSQMTRQARRLYVGNIPFGITEVNVVKVTYLLFSLLK